VSLVCTMRGCSLVAYDHPMAGEPAGAAVQEALFPSPQVRAIPSFSFDYPEGWELEESTRALAAVHPPEPIDGFWVNVLVDHSRVEATLDLQQAAVVTCAHLLSVHPDLRVFTERMAHFDGGRRDTYLRIAEMTDDGRPMTQMHALFFAPLVPGARTRDLFQIIATIPKTAPDELGVQVIDIVKSFRFESGPRA
jgi:hypothetical protein